MKQKTFIIAEVGVNHNGSIETAKKLIDIAFECGCDCVKFQTFKSENIVTANAQKADYQKTNDKNQLTMLRKLELSFDNFIELKKYCEKKTIMFLSTPFDIQSADFLNKIGLNLFKISSGEITNLPLLRRINFFKKPVILSTGMATFEEIQAAIDVLKDCQISLLHCTTQYPCPYREVNLNVIKTMKQKFNLEVGYSDHTKGIEVAIAAVALGATILEKHFTLDVKMQGPDHKASIEPKELMQMVKSIRNIEKALGQKEKTPTKSELKNLAVVRKSIVAKCKINKGEKFSNENLTTKRPAIGISPMKWDEIVGLIATEDYEVNDLI